MVCPLFVVGKIGFEKIVKEKCFEYCKHNKKLDCNYQPKCFPDSHVGKTVFVKVVYFFKHNTNLCE